MVITWIVPPSGSLKVNGDRWQPENWGNDPIWRIFFRWVVQPLTRKYWSICWFFLWKSCEKTDFFSCNFGGFLVSSIEWTHRTIVMILMIFVGWGWNSCQQEFPPENSSSKPSFWGSSREFWVVTSPKFNTAPETYLPKKISSLPSVIFQGVC